MLAVSRRIRRIAPLSFTVTAAVSRRVPRRWADFNAMAAAVGLIAIFVWQLDDMGRAATVAGVGVVLVDVGFRKIPKVQATRARGRGQSPIFP